MGEIVTENPRRPNGTAPDSDSPGQRRRMLRDPVGVICLAFLTLLALLALIGPLLTRYGPNTISPNAVLAAPGRSHLLGTDSSGRDVLARLLSGARYSLGGAILATSLAVFIGSTTGLLAGYYRKWSESLGSGLSDLIMALPGFLVLLAAATVIGPSTWPIMVILGVLYIPAFYRLVLRSVVAVRTEPYIDAARVSGLRDRAIIGRHILNIVRLPVVVQWSLLAGITIAIQAGLDFIGVDDPETPTWGNLLSDGFSHIYQRPILLLWPSLAIGLTSLAFVLLGNSLRDELARDARPRRRRANRSVEKAISHPNAAVEEHGPLGKYVGVDALLSIEGLSIGYDRPDGSVIRVVHDVSIKIWPGEVHGLVGESGSGKTQTAWALLGLLPLGGRVLSGTITFDGRDLTPRDGRPSMTNVRGTRIAYVPQEPLSNLDPSFTIGSQLTVPLRTHLGLSRTQARKRAMALLTQVGILDPARTFSAYPHEISGGMAQRVLIAGAISCNPDLLVADEATTALDVTTQAHILDLFRSLTHQLSLSVLLVTHNFGIVADLCDTVSVMREGRIVERGSVRAVFTDPKHDYTQSLFDSMLDVTDATDFTHVMDVVDKVGVADPETDVPPLGRFGRTETQ